MASAKILYLLLSICGVLSLANPSDMSPKKDLRNWRIIETSPDQNVILGQTFSIYCKVGGDNLVENDDWKKCTFYRESDGAACDFYYECEGALCGVGSGDFHIESVCDPRLVDVTYFGEDPNLSNNICGINVPNAGYEDKSNWRCLIEECDIVGCGTSDGNGQFDSADIYVNVR